MQPNYTDTVKKEIKICKNFAARVYAGAGGEYNLNLLNNKSETYDNCGLKVNGEIKIQSMAYKNYE